MWLVLPDMRIREKISEREMEGARISWDELTCVGYEVTEEATQSLCKDIKEGRTFGA